MKNIGRTRNEQDNPICRVHPLRRDGGHILRDLPVLRIQTGCAQSATKGETCGLTQAPHRLKGITLTRYLVTNQRLRYAIHLAISSLDMNKQDKNYIIESTAKVSDEVLELLASSKTTEPEQTENPKQAAGRETDTSEYPFIQLEADELVRMICDAYQTGVFSGKEQS